jgi:outer membrane receptor protein involved in Fe transport
MALILQRYLAPLYVAPMTGAKAAPRTNLGSAAPCAVTNPGRNITATSNDKQFGLYLQDDRVPVPKLTVNLGLRWDYETVPAWEDYRLPASVVAAINSPFPGAPGVTYAQALALGGININDYIGTGSNRHAPTNEFQPRLGLSFDINDDQRHVLFGGYARAHDREVP